MSNLICSYTEFVKQNTRSRHESHFEDQIFTGATPRHLGDSREACVYCAHDMFRKRLCGDRGRSRKDGRRIDFSICANCGWWYAMDRSFGNHGTADFVAEASGIARHYDVSSLEVPLAELRRHLVRHPHDLAHVDPRRFELLMKACLEDSFGPCEIVHTGRSGDGASPAARV